MKWFGTTWNMPVNEGENCPTPVGVPCACCGVPVGDGDRGVVLELHGGPEGSRELPQHLGCIEAAAGPRKAFKRPLIKSHGYRPSKTTSQGGPEGPSLGEVPVKDDLRGYLTSFKGQP